MRCAVSLLACITKHRSDKANEKNFPTLLTKADRKVGRIADLFIELNIREYGVNAPRFAEHGTERQRETNAEHPRLQLHTHTMHKIAYNKRTDAR